MAKKEVKKMAEEADDCDEVEMVEMVELMLLRDGTMHGKKGDKICVAADLAKHLTSIRIDDQGGGNVIQYRLAKPADEKEPPVKVESLTQHEAQALGVENKIVVPKEPLPQKASVDMAKLPVNEEQNSEP